MLKVQCESDEVWTVLFCIPLEDIEPLAEVEAYASICVLRLDEVVVGWF